MTYLWWAIWTEDDEENFYGTFLKEHIIVYDGRVDEFIKILLKKWERKIIEETLTDFFLLCYKYFIVYC